MEKLVGFLRGRYGSDSLNTALNGASIAFIVAGVLATTIGNGNLAGNIIGVAFYFLAFAALGFSIFRSLSCNVKARRREHEWYRCHISGPISKLRGKAKAKRAQRAKYRFFKCPECGRKVRVPRGKGKIRITCPKCGGTFIKKT